MKQLSKITLATVYGKKMPTLNKGDEPLALIRVTGIIQSVRISPSTLDPTKNSVTAKGDFVAVNCETGEEFGSNVLYPVGTAFSDMLETAEAGYMFSVEVTATHSSRSPVGYSYDFRSLIEVKPSDAMARLLSGIPAVVPRLAAPNEKPKK